MQLLQVTMTGAAVPLIPKGVQPANSKPFQVLILQTSSAHNIRVGDASVSATRGIVVGAGSTTPQIPVIIAPGLEYTSDLYEWYAYGTSGDLLDVLLLD